MNNNNYYEKLENNFSEFLNNLDRVKRNRHSEN